MKIGDRVSVVDDVLSGVVTDIVGNTVHIDSDEGFPLKYHPSELVVIEKNTLLKRIDSEDIFTHKQLKESKPRKKRPVSKRKEKVRPPMEVDLHIQKLTKNYMRLSNYDMLELQLDTAKRQLDFALSKRIQRVVFIHGVGEGVLKAELESLFRRYDNITYGIADARKYGHGATEVYIPQKAMQ
ncbi:Smr/MutS family protein [Altibacter sp. HG106]|uniref:Smr/MutS family protein n=1 Tax=Altibacter sp. HG106 TaxID=3023937 RepID=UPI00234FFF04|nr:Smr/MutS family protein [Altibacter sp. HG106]MDC7996177.1 DNA mismatch repair protein MutS [Altibacter sp. HG106]